MLRLVPIIVVACVCGCSGAPPAACPICSDETLRPASVPAPEVVPNELWASPVTAPIPADLPRRDTLPPPPLAQSEDVVCVKGDWTFVLVVRNRGSRSAVTVGRLYHHGGDLIGVDGQEVDTPWGVFRRLPFRGYGQGWLPVEES